MIPPSRALIASVMILGGAASLLAEEPRRAAQQKNVLARFDIAKDGDFILLPVTFKGATYSFLLDTGSTYNVFDSSLPIADSGTRSRVATPGGEVVMLNAAFARASVGGLSLLALDPVMILDFSKLSEVAGRDIRGIIGMTFLRHQVVRIDFDRGELVILKEPPPDSGDVLILREGPGRRPHLDVFLAGVHQTDCLLDTGANGVCSLTERSFRAMSDRGGLTLIGKTLVETLAGTSTHRVGRIPDLCVGEYRFPRVHVTESGTNSLGLDFCSRFVMTLDFPHDRIFLKPGKNFGRPDTSDLSGLHLIRQKGCVVIHSVDQQSTAEAAGLKAGDVLAEFDGRKVEDCSLFELRRRLSIEHPKLTVSIRRGAERHDVVLRLRPSSEK